MGGVITISLKTAEPVIGKTVKLKKISEDDGIAIIVLLRSSGHVSVSSKVVLIIGKIPRRSCLVRVSAEVITRVEVDVDDHLV